MREIKETPLQDLCCLYSLQIPRVTETRARWVKHACVTTYCLSLSPHYYN